MGLFKNMHNNLQSTNSSQIPSLESKVRYSWAKKAIAYASVPIIITASTLFPNKTYAQQKFQKPLTNYDIRSVFHDPVKWGCMPVGIEDTALVNIIKKSHKTEADKKRIRDYLMQQQNSIIIPDRVIAVNSIMNINPVETYAMNLFSNIQSQLTVYNADNEIQSLKKNKEMNRSDKRILGQISNSTYNRVLPAEIKESIQQALDDQLLEPSETIAIASKLAQYNLPGVLVGIVDSHPKEAYKGKKYPAESVPYFVYFTSVVVGSKGTQDHGKKEEDKYKTGCDSLKKEISGLTGKIDSVLATKQGGKKEGKKEEKAPTVHEHQGTRIILGASASYDPNRSKANIEPGITVGYSFGDFDITANAGYGISYDYSLADSIWESAFGSTTQHFNVKDDYWFAGANISYNIPSTPLRAGIGARYNQETTTTSSTVDEILRNRLGEVTRERTGEPQPTLTDRLEYMSITPNLGFDISNNVKLTIQADISKEKPGYTIGVNYNFKP